MRRTSPTAAILLTGLVLGSLSGCKGFLAGGNDPQNDGFYYCQEQVQPKFDNPDTVTWDGYEGGATGVAESYDYTTVAHADDASGATVDYDVTCSVKGTSGDFTLTGYTITEIEGVEG